MTAIRLRVLDDGDIVVRVADLAGHLKPGVLLGLDVVTSDEDLSSEQVSGDESTTPHVPDIKVGDRVRFVDQGEGFADLRGEVGTVTSIESAHSDREFGPLIYTDNPRITTAWHACRFEIVEPAKPAVPELIVGKKYRVKENPGWNCPGDGFMHFRYLLGHGDIVTLGSDELSESGNAWVWLAPNDMIFILPECLEGPIDDDEPKAQTIEEKIKDAKVIRIDGDYYVKEADGEFWISPWYKTYTKEEDYYPEELNENGWKPDDIEVIA